MADQPINYPKWVTPHASHITIVPKNGKQIAPKWDGKFFVNPTTGVLQVLVNNINEENLAMGVAP